VAQSIAPHAWVPVQVTSQAFGPQAMSPHALVPEQATSQSWPAPQVISPQALALVHRIVQSYPSGQATLPHGRPELHSIRQVLSWTSHDVHGLGQASNRGTQYPRSHVRLASHSSLPRHA
jgi:hypothetical protein